MTDAVVAMLQQNPFVEDFEAEHADKLALIAVRVRFERDQMIFREGDDCSDLYLLASGRSARNRGPSALISLRAA